MPANTSLADLTATQAIAMLCARDTTAAAYAQALFDRYDSGGFECLNAFISMNRSQVKHLRKKNCRGRCRTFDTLSLLHISVIREAYQKLIIGS